MSANLFNERFYSLREIPWHKLGIVSQTEVGAVEAFSQLTPYSIELQPLSIPSGTSIPYSAIVRTPVPDDPQERFFGIVGPEYQLIDPQTICEIYDREVHQPVETIGALGRGEDLFLTTKLPDYDIKGDPVENYLLVHSPYTGLSSLDIRVTGVRVVCQNTLMAARAQSSEVYKIIHDQHALDYFASWLGGLYERALDRAQVLQEAFMLFAGYKPVSADVTGIINKVYPDPKPPVRNAPDDVMAKREADYQFYLKSAKTSREAIQDLFEGKGTGMDIPATKGTGWGLYNSVTEWEDYRSTSRPESLSRQINSLFGDRAAKKELAYVTIQDAAAYASTPVHVTKKSRK